MADTKSMKTATRLAGIGGVLGVCLIGAGAWFVLRPPPIPQPPPGVEPLRWLPLEGTVNARDIGGYKTNDGRTVRWNLVYRSDALANVTEDGCETFRKLGIKVVVDYRNRVVSSPLFGGDRECIHQAAQVVLLRVKAVKSPDRPTYVATVEAYKDAYRQTFEFLADPKSLPILYHCHAGKDRTGIMTALLLTLLGADRETIVADYMLSQLAYPPANRQAIVDLLDEVDARGGIEAYLDRLGISPKTRQAIRRNLLE